MVGFGKGGDGEGAGGVDGEGLGGRVEDEGVHGGGERGERGAGCGGHGARMFRVEESRLGAVARLRRRSVCVVNAALDK